MHDAGLAAVFGLAQIPSPITQTSTRTSLRTWLHGLSMSFPDPRSRSSLRVLEEALIHGVDTGAQNPAEGFHEV